MSRDLFQAGTDATVYSEDEVEYQHLEEEQQQQQFFAQQQDNNIATSHNNDSFTSSSSRDDESLEEKEETGGRTSCSSTSGSRYWAESPDSDDDQGENQSHRQPPLATRQRSEVETITPQLFQQPLQEEEVASQRSNGADPDHHVHRSKRNREDSGEDGGGELRTSNSRRGSGQHRRVVEPSQTLRVNSTSPNVQPTSDVNDAATLVANSSREIAVRFEKLHWDPTDHLNQGASSFVFKARDRTDGSIVVMKEIDKRKFPEGGGQEIASMKKFAGSTRVIQLKKSYQTEDKDVIVTDYFEGGDFFDLAKRLKGQEDLCRKFFVQLLRGLEEFRAKGCLHRDLKPENLFLKGNGGNLSDPEAELIIADLGLCVEVSDATGGKVVEERGIRGTFCYCSPERLKQQPYGFSSEMWACGCILFLWFENTKAFSGRRHLEVLHHQRKRALPPFSAQTSPELRDLLTKLLIHDPEQRITLQEALQHPWCRTFASSRAAATPSPPFTTSTSQQQAIRDSLATN